MYIILELIRCDMVYDWCVFAPFKGMLMYLVVAVGVVYRSKGSVGALVRRLVLCYMKVSIYSRQPGAFYVISPSFRVTVSIRNQLFHRLSSSCH